MLQITVKSAQMFDEKNNSFIDVSDTVVNLEHSLLAISKWESIYKKPYLIKQEFNTQETIDYIKCMCLNNDIPDDVFYAIYTNPQLMKKINSYIEDPHTATTINDVDDKKKRKKEVITSELIYYWMVANQIPFSCENWHIDRLLTLIRVCGVKNQPEKKESLSATYARNRSLNAARRAKYHSKG